MSLVGKKDVYGNEKQYSSKDGWQTIQTSLNNVKIEKCRKVKKINGWATDVGYSMTKTPC